MIRAAIMNKVFLVKYFIYLFLCIMVLLVSACNKDTRRNAFELSIDNLNDKKVVYNKNILNDTKFENDTLYWKYNTGVIFTNINNKPYCFIKGSSSQNRVYQSIKVDADTLYRFSFDLKTDKNQGAFIIFRDDNIKKEMYYYCVKSSGEKHYTWDFFPHTSGPGRIALATYSEGDFFFSNVSLMPISVYKQLFDRLIVMSPLFFIPLVIVFSLYYKTMFLS